LFSVGIAAGGGGVGAEGEGLEEVGASTALVLALVTGGLGAVLCRKEPASSCREVSGAWDLPKCSCCCCGWGLAEPIEGEDRPEGSDALTRSLNGDFLAIAWVEVVSLRIAFIRLEAVSLPGAFTGARAGCVVGRGLLFPCSEEPDGLESPLWSGGVEAAVLALISAFLALEEVDGWIAFLDPLAYTLWMVCVFRWSLTIFWAFCAVLVNVTSVALT